MIQLAEHDLCTGCGACMAVCAHNSITMQSDAAGVLYPVINTDVCKECHLCESRCPVLKPVEGHRPRKSYACWNNIDSERNTSALGGIAIAFYGDALKKGYVCVGVSQNDDFTVVTFGFKNDNKENITKIHKQEKLRSQKFLLNNL